MFDLVVYWENHPEGMFFSLFPKYLSECSRRRFIIDLSSIYLEDVRIRSIIRQLMALALVPKEDVCLLFADLRQELTDDEMKTLAILFKYFDDQWMRQIPV